MASDRDLFAVFPSDDDEFEDVIVVDVRRENNFFVISRADGWHFGYRPLVYVPIKPGMVARFYGKGIGFEVRGLFVDGVEVFYKRDGQR